MSYDMDPLYSNPKWPSVESLDVVWNHYERIRFHEENYCVSLMNTLWLSKIMHDLI